MNPCIDLLMWHYNENVRVMCLQRLQLTLLTLPKRPDIPRRANSGPFDAIMGSSSNPKLNRLCSQRWHIYPQHQHCNFRIQSPQNSSCTFFPGGRGGRELFHFNCPHYRENTFQFAGADGNINRRCCSSLWCTSPPMTLWLRNTDLRSSIHRFHE